jgi:hypothetical protein
MTESSSTSIKVATPEAFDGSPLKFRDWHRQVLIYIRGKKVTADDDRILVALSYMKSGTAAAWANRFFDANLDGLGTWAEFETQLKAAFEDKTQGRKAREKLENLHQGSLRIDDFVSRFESLTQDAGMDSHESELIRLLERNVKSDIIDAIYASGMLPDTYPDYKSRVLSLGRLWEQRQEQRAQEHHRHVPQAAVTSKPSSNPSAQPTTDKRTPTGVVFGGRGKPMELDALRRENRCFTCGAVGHFRRECPDKDNTKKVNVRAMVLDLSVEEREELKKALREEEDGPGEDQDFQ